MPLLYWERMKLYDIQEHLGIGGTRSEVFKLAITELWNKLCGENEDEEENNS